MCQLHTLSCSRAICCSSAHVCGPLMATSRQTSRIPLHISSFSPYIWENICRNILLNLYTKIMNFTSWSTWKFCSFQSLQAITSHNTARKTCTPTNLAKRSAPLWIYLLCQLFRVIDYMTLVVYIICNIYCCGS